MLRIIGLTNLAVLAGVMGVLALGSSPAAADVGFRFDYTQLNLSYTLVALPPAVGKVGDLTVSSPGFLSLSKFDLGADDHFGGGDDTLLDSVYITGSGDMAFSFSADVIRLGANDYQIVGRVTGSDTILFLNSHEADVASTVVNYTGIDPVNGGVFSFAGHASTIFGNDAILINRPPASSSWTFTGEDHDALDPDEDGTLTTVSLPAGRELFDAGAIVLFEIGVDFVADLDAFLGSARSGLGGADLKLDVVVPAPGAMVLGAIGLGLVGWMKRRLS